ncbi:unnamed protein product [Durusdinium trenchii]|uniref:C3H1-type domain-containing protein n=1 Tax=Durusdinium trenchii TaxID=1381693 RepID=A0ABP0J2N5_9DINO
MAKLCYRFSFIHEEPAFRDSHRAQRGQSCPELSEIEWRWPEWQSHIQVRKLYQRSQHVRDQMQRALVFPKPGISHGSHEHPEVCNRSCILFLHGKCQEDAECGFCHASHQQRAVSFNQGQRRIVSSWSKVRLLEVVLPYLWIKVEASNHPGATVLLDLVERELAIRRIHDHSITNESRVPGQIGHTLACMTLSALVGVICMKKGEAPFFRLLKKALIDFRRQVGGFDP